uniref:Glycosyltransferase family 2 protein n=1 Tax=Anisakis simplex TaxID=6269 RepID=A0A0M3J923_ANISI
LRILISHKHNENLIAILRFQFNPVKPLIPLTLLVVVVMFMKLGRRRPRLPNEIKKNPSEGVDVPLTLRPEKLPLIIVWH